MHVSCVVDSVSMSFAIINFGGSAGGSSSSNYLGHRMFVRSCVPFVYTILEEMIEVVLQCV